MPSVEMHTWPSDDSNRWRTREQTLSVVIGMHSRHLMLRDCRRSLDAWWSCWWQMGNSQWMYADRTASDWIRTVPVSVVWCQRQPPMLTTTTTKAVNYVNRTILLGEEQERFPNPRDIRVEDRLYLPRLAAADVACTSLSVAAVVVVAAVDAAAAAVAVAVAWLTNVHHRIYPMPTTVGFVVRCLSMRWICPDYYERHAVGYCCYSNLVHEELDRTCPAFHLQRLEKQTLSTRHQSSEVKLHLKRFCRRR